MRPAGVRSADFTAYATEGLFGPMKPVLTELTLILALLTGTLVFADDMTPAAMEGWTVEQIRLAFGPPSNVQADGRRETHFYERATGTVKIYVVNGKVVGTDLKDAAAQLKSVARPSQASAETSPPLKDTLAQFKENPRSTTIIALGFAVLLAFLVARSIADEVVGWVRNSAFAQFTIIFGPILLFGSGAALFFDAPSILTLVAYGTAAFILYGIYCGVKALRKSDWKKPSTHTHVTVFERTSQDPLVQTRLHKVPLRSRRADRVQRRAESDLTYVPGDSRSGSGSRTTPSNPGS
jgi:hypothetical protein